MWIVFACLSAVFAGFTAILCKCGIKKTDSDVATALRTIVVLIFAWIMTFVVGSYKDIANVSAKSLLFLILSGLATGASWICYFKALSMADINKVVPIDKSSTVITVLFAIIIFHETNNLWIKLAGTALIGVGVMLTVEKKDIKSAPATVTAAANAGGGENNGSVSADTVLPDVAEKGDLQPAPAKVKVKHNVGWIVFAVLSAVFAAATSILAKNGIENVESNLATAIRTTVVLVAAWLLVIAKKKKHLIKGIDKKELLFIALSGLATGASWLCYYYAIAKGVVSVVVPIDKLSVLLTVAFSYIFLKEKLKLKSAVGLIIMTAGTLLMAIFA
ncbi:MAG TPA: multidrug DMT transporter permease [Clostridiales bacterium]|nr:multidrug DMT transporter permease [Clostridiales bacterium]